MKENRMKSIASWWTCKVNLTSPRFEIPRGECGGMEVGEKELEHKLETEQHHELKPGWTWFLAVPASFKV
jgi:hypothetical protein